MKHQHHVNEHSREILAYLKSRFSVYHLSNIFFRDIQFGIQEYFAAQKTKLTYAQAENLARAFTDRLEKEKILAPIDRQTWVVHYPEFRKPQAKPAVPAKPAASAPAVPGAAAKPAAQPQPQTTANG
jgi:hypothetical protein